jgi:hypothetical protein
MPSIDSSIEFRNLHISEIPQVLDLCRQEGRHMGQAAELRTWYQFDPSGFFVAVNCQGKLRNQEQNTFL